MKITIEGTPGEIGKLLDILNSNETIVEIDSKKVAERLSKTQLGR